MASCRMAKDVLDFICQAFTHESVILWTGLKKKNSNYDTHWLRYHLENQLFWTYKFIVTLIVIQFNLKKIILNNNLSSFMNLKRWQSYLNSLLALRRRIKYSNRNKRLNILNNFFELINSLIHAHSVTWHDCIFHTQLSQ